MTSTALHPHLHFTAPTRRTLLLLLAALVLAPAAAATWVAVDRNDGSRVPAIVGDGVPLWPPLSPPGGSPLPRLKGWEQPLMDVSWGPTVMIPPPADWELPG